MNKTEDKLTAFLENLPSAVRNLPLKYKWPLVFIVNTLPFVLNVAFFSLGIINDLVFIFLYAIFLVAFNYWACRKVFSYILVHLYVVVCIIVSRKIATDLYYQHVSNDYMTPLVGGFLTFAESVLFAIATVVTATIKGILNKKKR